MEPNQRIKSAIIEVVDNQLAANDPPQVNQTLERLVSEGFSELEAKELIGNVVVVEVFQVMKDGEPFDLQRYVAALNRLPAMPEQN